MDEPTLAIIAFEQVVLQSSGCLKVPDISYGFFSNNVLKNKSRAETASSNLVSLQSHDGSPHTKDLRNLCLGGVQTLCLRSANDEVQNA